MNLEYDQKADAVYVRLLNEPVAYTKSLDEARNVDYSATDEPVGVEWMCVSEGIDLSGIPQADRISDLLFGKSFKVFA